MNFTTKSRTRRPNWPRLTLALSALGVMAAFTGCAATGAASRRGPITARPEGPDFVTARSAQLQQGGMDKRAAAQLALTENSLSGQGSALRYDPFAPAQSRTAREQDALVRRLEQQARDAGQR